MPTATTAKSTVEVRLLPERTSRRHLPRVLEALSREYGKPVPPEACEEPLKELIAAALDEGDSSRKDADNALKEIEKRFVDWNEVRVSRPAEVEAAIEPISNARERAIHIVRSLNGLFDQRGDLSLAFLCEEKSKDAQAFLESLDGADPEMVARVMLFGLGFPAVPLNSHIIRVGNRLGYVDSEAETETIRRRMDHICTKDAMHPVFELFTEHGRKTCLVTKPKCRQCPIKDMCQTGKELAGSGQKRSSKKGAGQTRSQKTKTSRKEKGS